MVSPLVIAMPETMAKALGWPTKAIGYSDILQLATDPNGWGSVGHPEWGAFKLGKTNPNFSTSGLSSLVAQYYAFAGKQDDLSQEDIDNPDVEQKARDVESAVVHYGDTTLTFLNHLYEADRRGAPLSYASAVAVEEQSVVNYNEGNPDGKLDPGEKPKVPHEKLVAIYPKEGTLFSDNPYIVLDAKWVSADQKKAAAKFGEFVQQPANQRLALQYGFRPGNSSVALGAPIDAKHGLDPAQPQGTTLGQPDPPEVLKALIDRWNIVRKGARADGDRRVGLDDAAGDQDGRRSSISPSRGHRTRSTSSAPTTRSVCGRSPPTSARRPLRLRRVVPMIPAATTPARSAT